MRSNSLHTEQRSRQRALAQTDRVTRKSHPVQNLALITALAAGCSLQLPAHEEFFSSVESGGSGGDGGDGGDAASSGAAGQSGGSGGVAGSSGGAGSGGA